MAKSKLTSKGQITIPKEIRDYLNVQEGARVIFVMRGNDVVLKVARGTILDLKGSVKPTRRPEDADAVRGAVKRAVSARVARNG